MIEDGGLPIFYANKLQYHTFGRPIIVLSILSAINGVHAFVNFLHEIKDERKIVCGLKHYKWNFNLLICTSKMTNKKTPYSKIFTTFISVETPYLIYQVMVRGKWLLKYKVIHQVQGEIDHYRNTNNCVHVLAVLLGHLFTSSLPLTIYQMPMSCICFT